MNRDEAALASLGYKQDFKRAFSKVELFGISFSIVGVFPSIAGVLVFAIPYGGPVAMIWGWAACSFFLLFVAAAISELGSSAPTAGGLYYWTHYYASPRCRNVLAWVVGYTNTIAYAVGATSCDWACATSIVAGASIGSDEAFAPTTSQTFGVFTGIMLTHVFMASLATSVLARLQLVYISLNILLCLGVIIALPIATPKEFMNSASYTFGQFENLSMWPNGFAFLLSFLAPLWTIGAFDSPTHISEEASNASFAVPFATMVSPITAMILGWAVNVAIAFCMGTDLETILASPIGQPLATILFNSFGKNGSLAVWSFVIIAQYIMGASALTACSRQMWAFARDGALPFSKIIYRVNQRTRTPVYAVIASAIIAYLAGLLVFAGPVAVSAIFAACVVGQYIALSIPIACRLLCGREWVPGVFSLGKFSHPVGWMAVLFMTFASIVLIFPSNPSPVQSNMNYTVLVIGGWILLCLIYYYLPVYGGKYWFKGPVSNLPEETLEGSVDSKTSMEYVDVKAATEKRE